MQMHQCRHMYQMRGDLKTLEQLTTLLRPFFDITMWVSASSYVTISAAGPSLVVLRQNLRVSDLDTPVIRCCKEAAQAKLDKYFDDTEEEKLLDLCSFLDPRFRTFQHKPDSKTSVENRVLAELSTNYENAPPGLHKQATVEAEQPGGSGLGRLLASLSPDGAGPSTSVDNAREHAHRGTPTVQCFASCSIAQWSIEYFTLAIGTVMTALASEIFH